MSESPKSPSNIHEDGDPLNASCSEDIVQPLIIRRIEKDKFAIDRPSRVGEPSEIDNSTNGSMTETTTTSLRKVKLQPFAVGNPSLWFATTELIFAGSNITTESERFYMLLQALDMSQIERIQTIVEAASKEQGTEGSEVKPYTDAKTVLLWEYGDNEE